MSNPTDTTGAILLGILQERRAYIEKEVNGLNSRPEIVEYLEGIGKLNSQLADLEKHAEAVRTRFSDELREPITRTAKRPSARRSGRSVEERIREFEDVIETTRQGNIYRRPYREMLENFRGSEPVRRRRVVRWVNERYGFSHAVGYRYVELAVKRGMAEMVDEKMVRFPTPSGGVTIDGVDPIRIAELGLDRAYGQRD